MLTVTATATAKLLEALQGLTENPELATRIIVSLSTPDRLEMILDKEGDGDQVVESEGGIKVLLIEPDLALALEGIVLDYQETPEGEGFTMMELDTDS